MLYRLGSETRSPVTEMRRRQSKGDLCDAVAGEITRMACDVLHGESAVFSWIGEHRDRDCPSVDAEPWTSFVRDPMGNPPRIDARRLAGMVAKQQRVLILHERTHVVSVAPACLHPIERGGADRLIELLFWSRETAVASLSVAGATDAKPSVRESAQVAEPLQRFIEFILQNHPRVGRLRLRRFELTPREIEITELVAHGATNGHIAHSLGIKVATVKTHVLRVLSKTNCSNRTELAALLSRG